MLIPIDNAIFKGTPFEWCPFELLHADVEYWASSGMPMYTPFRIIVVTRGADVVTVPRRSWIKWASHDLCHCLSLYMKGEKERLLQTEMGYEWVQPKNWTRQMWYTEVEVLSMQYALLRSVTPCRPHFSDTCAIAHSRIRPDQAIPNFLEYVFLRFDFWVKQKARLIREYNGMVEFCTKNRYTARDENNNPNER